VTLPHNNKTFLWKSAVGATISFTAIALERGTDKIQGLGGEHVHKSNVGY